MRFTTMFDILLNRGGASHQKIDKIVSNPVELRIVDKRLSRSLPWHRVHHNFCKARARPVTHQEDSISKQDRFVDIVRDHENGLMSRQTDAQKFILDNTTRQRIECPERLVHQKHLWCDGECASDPHSLAHAAR